MVHQLIEQRAFARSQGLYETADKIRDQLDSMNTFVFDTPDGQEVYFELPGTTREDVVKKIQDDARAEKQFDAWLFSMKSKMKTNK
jgi:hypothetical protein